MTIEASSTNTMLQRLDTFIQSNNKLGFGVALMAGSFYAMPPTPPSLIGKVTTLALMVIAAKGFLLAAASNQHSIAKSSLLLGVGIPLAIYGILNAEEDTAETVHARLTGIFLAVTGYGGMIFSLCPRDPPAGGQIETV